MRAIVTSSIDWSNEQAVIDALCKLPPSSVVLLPTKKGACEIVRNRIDDLKLEIEDWADDDLEYQARGSAINTEMLATDIDVCFAFLSKNSHTAKDLVRQARIMDLEVITVEG